MRLPLPEGYGHGIEVALEATNRRSRFHHALAPGGAGFPMGRKWSPSQLNPDRPKAAGSSRPSSRSVTVNGPGKLPPNQGVVVDVSTLRCTHPEKGSRTRASGTFGSPEGTFSGPECLCHST